MKAHWTTLVIGTLFVGSAAGLRGAAREMAHPLEVLKRVAHAGPAEKSVPDAQLPEIASLEPPHTDDSVAPPSEPQVLGLGLVEATFYSEAGHAADMLEEDLLAVFPFTGSQEFTLDGPLPEPQRSMAEGWSEWKRASIHALPEELREDSDHRKAIDEHFRAAMQGLLTPEEIESIEAVGFTDIDEIAGNQASATKQMTPMTTSRLLVLLLERSKATPVVYGVNITTSVPGVNK